MDYNLSDSEDEEFNDNELFYLRRSDFEVKAYAISKIYDLFLKNSNVNLEPDFQRMFSWTHNKIVTFMNNLYYMPVIPSFILYKCGDKKFECIDGQHRLKILNSFLTNKPLGSEYTYIEDKKTMQKIFFKLNDDIIKKYGSSKVRIMNKEEIKEFMNTLLVFQIIKTKIEDKVKHYIFNCLQNGEPTTEVNTLKNFDHVISNYIRKNKLVSEIISNKWKDIIKSSVNIDTSKGLNIFIKKLIYTFIKLILVTDRNSLDICINNDVLYQSLKTGNDKTRLSKDINTIVKLINKNFDIIAPKLIDNDIKITSNFYLVLHIFLINKPLQRKKIDGIILDTKFMNTFNNSSKLNTKNKLNELYNAIETKLTC